MQPVGYEDLSGLHSLPPFPNTKWYPQVNQTKALDTLLDHLRQYPGRDAAVWLLQSNLWIVKEGKIPRFSFVNLDYRIFNQAIRHIDEGLYTRTEKAIECDEGKARIFVMNQGIPFRQVFTFIMNQPNIPQQDSEAVSSSRLIRLKTDLTGKSVKDNVYESRA